MSDREHLRAPSDGLSPLLDGQGGGGLPSMPPALDAAGNSTAEDTAAAVGGGGATTPTPADAPFAAAGSDDDDEDGDDDDRGDGGRGGPRAQRKAPTGSSVDTSAAAVALASAASAAAADGGSGDGSGSGGGGDATRARTASQLQLSVKKEGATDEPSAVLAADAAPEATEKKPSPLLAAAQRLSIGPGAFSMQGPSSGGPSEATPQRDGGRAAAEAAEASAAAAEHTWRNRAKHVFILSSAGRPIFTRYGDESEFSELFAILEVLVSMASSTGGGADVLRRVASSSGHAIYFHQAGEVLHVMVTRTRESSKSCVRQLKLIHNQLLSVLPTVNAVLARNPGYDVRRMFSLADVNVMQSLIKRMSTDLPFYMRALHTVALPADFRADVDAILRDCYGGEDHLYSFLFFRGMVVALVCPPKQPLHPDDVLLLLNFTHCIAVSQGGEVWAPICLPRFNDSGYMWSYTMNVSLATRMRHGSESVSASTTAPPAPAAPAPAAPAPAAAAASDGMLLVQLATSQEAFPELSASGNEVLDRLVERDLVREIETVALHGTHIHIDDQVVGCAAEVLFLVFVSDSSSQLAMSDLPPQLRHAKSARKELFRLLVKLRDKLLQVSKSATPLVLHCTELYNVLVQKGGGGELFLVCLATTPKKVMMTCAAAALRWVKAREQTLMITKTVHWPQ